MIASRVEKGRRKVQGLVSLLHISRRVESTPWDGCQRHQRPSKWSSIAQDVRRTRLNDNRGLCHGFRSHERHPVDGAGETDNAAIKAGLITRRCRATSLMPAARACTGGYEDQRAPSPPASVFTPRMPRAGPRALLCAPPARGPRSARPRARLVRRERLRRFVAQAPCSRARGLPLVPTLRRDRDGRRPHRPAVSGRHARPGEPPAALRELP